MLGLGAVTLPSSYKVPFSMTKSQPMLPSSGTCLPSSRAAQAPPLFWH